jgi:hypothetical protein
MEIVAVTEQLQDGTVEAAPAPATGRNVWIYAVAAALALCAMGTWWVWFSAYMQRKFIEDDVRAACHRLMPEASARCFDTVIIQRGGMRR